MISSYTDEEKKILEQYFTSIDSPVFGLVNLPEVIKGTLFSRYSRTAKDLKRLFLDEFYSNEDINSVFESPAKNKKKNGVKVEKAEDFYDRVLVGYGDDSVAELGGAHAAIEEVSMLATKSIEEHRIGLSPLEKSTRYVYYDNKINGEYSYYKDQKILNSEFGELYIKTNEMLFDTYSKIVREIQPVLKKIYPGDETESAYKATIRAKACDIARSLLPLSAKTNMGVYGDGRALEYLLTNMLADPLDEVVTIGNELHEALRQIIPAFVKRATNERGDVYRKYLQETKGPLNDLRSNYEVTLREYESPQVRMVDSDPRAIEKIIAALLYEYTDMEYQAAYDEAMHLSMDEKEVLLRQLGKHRANRHHKPLRAVEEPYFAFEIIADWGVYKDLMRHRMMTRHKKMFTSELGYYVPYEIKMTGYTNLFCEAMNKAVEAYKKIKTKFPYEAQYLVTHGSYTNFYLRLNLRGFAHMVELRSIPQGHPSYRYIAQEMAKRVGDMYPLLAENIFKFVDYNNYDLERLDAFRKLEKKASAAGVKAFEE